MSEIEEIMSPIVLSVGEHTPVDEAIGIMLINKITGLPVVDDKGQIIGVLTEKDVIGLLNEIELSAVVG